MTTCTDQYLCKPVIRPKPMSYAEFYSFFCRTIDAYMNFNWADEEKAILWCDGEPRQVIDLIRKQGAAP